MIAYRKRFIVLGIVSFLCTMMVLLAVAIVPSLNPDMLGPFASLDEDLLGPFAGDSTPPEFTVWNAVCVAIHTQRGTSTTNEPAKIKIRSAVTDAASPPNPAVWGEWTGWTASYTLSQSINKFDTVGSFQYWHVEIVAKDEAGNESDAVWDYFQVDIAGEC